MCLAQLERRANPELVQALGRMNATADAVYHRAVRFHFLNAEDAVAKVPFAGYRSQTGMPL